jgi:hypothetical protein
MFYVYAESIDTVWLKQQTEGKTFDHLQTMCKRNRKTLDFLYDQRRFSENRNRPIFLKNQWFCTGWNYSQDRNYSKIWYILTLYVKGALKSGNNIKWLHLNNKYLFYKQQETTWFLWYYNFKSIWVVSVAKTCNTTTSLAHFLALLLTTTR